MAWFSPKKIILRLFLVAFVAGSVLFLLSRVEYPVPNWGDTFGLTGQAAPPLENGLLVGQPFTPPVPKLSYLGLRFGTYRAKAGGRLEVTLLEGREQPARPAEIRSRRLAAATIDAASLTDNEVWRWDLPVVRLRPGQGLFLVVERAAPEAGGGPVTVWLDNVPEWDQGPALIIRNEGGGLVPVEAAGHLSLTVGYDRLPSVLAGLWERPWAPRAAFLVSCLAAVFCFWPARRRGVTGRRAARSGRTRGSARGAVGMTAVSVVIGLVLCEAALRLMGFSFQLYLTEIEFGWPDPVKVRVSYLPDPDLLWVQKDYHYRLAKAARLRPRIVFMGDSCTDFGSYDKYFAELVGGRRPGLRPAYFNAGVGGWTSYQGLRQLERDLIPLKPEVVTVYFGWNDHWASFGVEDKDIHRVALSRSAGLGDLRLVQLASKIVAVRQSRLGANRVSLEDFAANLTRIVELCRDRSIVPVLLTAPSAHEIGREPEYLKERWLQNLGDLVPLHQSYAEAVRRVAEETGAFLLDLERRFAEYPPAVRREKYFKGDGIHPTEQGDRLIARLIYDLFEKEGLAGLGDGREG